MEKICKYIGLSIYDKNGTHDIDGYVNVTFFCYPEVPFKKNGLISY